MALQMSSREASGVSIVALNGRIVLGEESNALREKIKSILAEGKKKIVLDMGNIAYLDSGGVATLVAALQSARARGASIKISGPTPNLQEILRLTKTLVLFDVFDNEEEAVKSFAAEMQDFKAADRPNNLQFHPLERQKVHMLLDRPAAQEVYLDALMFLHDAVCEFSPEDFHATFEYREVVQKLAELEQLAIQFNNELQENIRINVRVAGQLREQALRRLESQVKGAAWNEAGLLVSRFLSDVLKTYHFIIGLPRPAIKQEDVETI